MLIVGVASLAAQVTPPPPGTPASQIQSQINGRGLQDLVRSRIASSGLTADQIRQRLASLGYDPTTLDPYMAADTTNLPQPSQTHLAAIQALGITALAPAAASPAAAAAAPPTPAVTPPAMPAPTREERAEALRVFGLDVFARSTTQFQPVTTGPVPDSYIVGPGDQLILVLTGDVEKSYTLPVMREGFIVIPQVGQVWVNGLTLSALREQMYTRLGRFYSGMRRGPDATAHFLLTLGQLRANQVFVTGEVAQPGTYLVSPVASVLNALYLAGGPTANGSFRDVQIVRGGRVGQHVDLYQYLLRGNNLDSIRLEPGDVIFIPIHGDHVSIRGEVNRPAIYELKPGETLYHLIQFAGGVTTPAQLRRARITRILPPEQRTEPGVDRVVIDADLAQLVSDSTRAPILRPEDDVRVFAVRSEVRNLVTLSGNVWHPGSYAFRPGMRAWDLVRMGRGLEPQAYLARAHIIRLDQVRDRLSVIPFSLDTTESGAPVENPELSEFDEVQVFSIRQFERPDVIEVRGAVRQPGAFGRFPGMLLRDAIMRAGGLDPFTYTDRAFISRLRPDSTRMTVPVGLVVDSAGAVQNDDPLQAFDIVLVYALGRYTETYPVTIAGAVREPRTERFEQGMTLGDLVLRAGGLQPMTYKGRAFISRLQPDSTRKLLSVELVADTLGVVHNTDTLQAFDIVQILPISRFTDEFSVAIGGEVRDPHPERFQEGMTLRDLIIRAGGLKPTADLTVEIARLVEPRQRGRGRIAQLIHVRVDSTYVVPAEAVRFYFGERDSLAVRVKPDSAREFGLRPYDQVTVRRLPEFELPRVVRVTGEVRYPGPYALQTRTERLRDVIQRAGGLKPTAFAEGFRLYRSGNLVNVELPGVLRSARHRDNVILQPGDSMVVPEYNPVVVVQGAVNSPSAVLYRPGADLDYYIHNAGGYAIDADGGRTSVRYANGSADVRSRVLLFFHTSPEPGPGSVVTVPLIPAADRVNAQTLIANLAQILTAALTLVIVATRL